MFEQDVSEIDFASFTYTYTYNQFKLEIEAIFPKVSFCLEFFIS